VPKSIHSEPYKRLLALLIEQRKEAGLSQYELAERLGRPQSFVAKIEGGERRLDVLEFFEVAHAIGADPYRILRIVEAAILNNRGDITQ
jgi:transcriptional regulator with XRE-family HTH domain